MYNPRPINPIDVICYPYIFYDKPVLEPTDMVVLPSYVLNTLYENASSSDGIIIISLANKITRKKIICSIHENVSHDHAYCPQWIMDYLGLSPGDTVSLVTEKIPVVKSVKFKPLHPAFYSLEDAIGTMNAVLKNYRTLTRNTIISFKTNVNVDGMKIATEIQLKVVEVQPFTSVLIVDPSIREDSQFRIDIEENPEIMPKEEPKKKKTSKKEEKTVHRIKIHNDLNDSKRMHESLNRSFELDDEEEEKGEVLTALTFDNPMDQSSFELKGSHEVVNVFDGDGHRLGRSIEFKDKDKPLDPDSVMCELCNAPVRKANYKMHKLRCQKMYKLCPHCGKRLILNSQESVDHLAGHEQEPCQQCGKIMEKQHLKEHYNNLCPKRLVACKYCKLMKEADIIAQHQKECGGGYEKCPNCGKNVQNIEMENHMNDECPFSEKNQRRMEEESRRASQQSFNSFGNINLNGMTLDPSIISNMGNQMNANQVECPMCMMPFPNAVDLETHMLCYHPELYD